MNQNERRIHALYIALQLRSNNSTLESLFRLADKIERYIEEGRYT